MAMWTVASYVRPAGSRVVSCEEDDTGVRRVVIMQVAQEHAFRGVGCASSTRPEPGPPEDEAETMLVVGSWTYAGAGWRTTADAALALAAADAARWRRPAAAKSAA